MYDNGIFTSAYKDLREGIAAKRGVIAKNGAAPAKKEDPKAKGGKEEKGANTSDEDRVKQALYDIRYRAKRESVPVGQAMTDYLKHSGSLGPKARAELKKRLMGEEVVDEAVYGGTPEKKKDTRMTVTNADKKANTKAYQAFKAGDKRYKAADHMGEGYKGKHGQSDKEYADSRSQGGKMVSGDSKQSGAEYTHGRRVKAANPGMQPDVGGKTKPKSQGKMDSGTRADLKYRKANLMKKEEVEIGEGLKPYPAEKVARKREAVKKKEDIHIARGEYDKADKQYKRGVSLAMKTKMKKEEVEIGEGLKQARKNVGAGKCWDGYKAKGTKTKDGKEVPNCVKENDEEMLQKRQLQINRKKLQLQTKATQAKKKTDIAMLTSALWIISSYSSSTMNRETVKSSNVFRELSIKERESSFFQNP